MTNAPFAGVHEMRDVESLNHYRQAVAAGADPEAVLRGLRAMGRDNARTPVQWDGTRNAGFTTGEPWLAVNPNHTWLNAQAQYDDPDSVFNHYRKLIGLRHELPVIALGDFRMLLADHPHVYAYERTLDDTRLLVVANLCGAAQTVDLAADWSADDVILANTDDVRVSPGRVDLGPWQALVFQR
jgi:oligo-1,6-glucosidase